MSFSSNQVTMNATMRITLCLCLLFAIADLAWGGVCDGPCTKKCSGQPDTCGWACTCKSFAESSMLCGYEYQPDWCDRIEPDSLRIEATTSELMSTLVSKYNNLDKTRRHPPIFTWTQRSAPFDRLSARKKNLWKKTNFFWQNWNFLACNLPLWV